MLTIIGFVSAFVIGWYIADTVTKVARSLRTQCKATSSSTSIVVR